MSGGHGIKGGTTDEVFQEHCFLCEWGAPFVLDFEQLTVKIFYMHKNLCKTLKERKNTNQNWYFKQRLLILWCKENNRCLIFNNLVVTIVFVCLQMKLSDLANGEYACMQRLCLQNLSPFDQFHPTVPQSLVAQVVPADDNINQTKSQLEIFDTNKCQISFSKHRK